MKGDYVEVLNKSTGKPIKAWVKNNKKFQFFAKYFITLVVNRNMEIIYDR